MIGLFLVVTIATQTVIPTQATYYAQRYENRRMANGKIYHSKDIIAAYNRWPLGTIIQIYNPVTGSSVITKISDRKIGPGIDLSPTLFEMLGIPLKQGHGKVVIRKLK